MLTSGAPLGGTRVLMVCIIGGAGRVSLVQEGQELSVQPGGIRTTMPSTLFTTVISRIGHPGHTGHGQRVLDDVGKFIGGKIGQ